MDRLLARVQDYAWGDRSFIAELQDRVPTGEPEAELWMGAHPGAPSVLEADDVELGSHIAADPIAALGEAAPFGELPFLAKVLAAAQPLSIQVHPDAEQARAGFERENDRGLALDDPARSYRDPRHKPELLCALTPFDARCGFRRLDESAELVASFGHPALQPLEARLTAPGDDGEVLRNVLAWLLTSSAEVSGLSTAVAEACHAASHGPWRTEIEWIPRIHDFYPGDPGVVVALLLNHVRLDPGEAISFGAGVLHCYLQGAGIEVMANSDNVVRGGLTSKHIDITELLRVVDCRPSAPRLETPIGPVHTYRSPASEFELSRLVLDGRFEARVHGPEILIATDGRFTLRTEESRLDLSPGEPVWIDAADRRYVVEGAGTVFRTSVPQLGPDG